MICVPHVNSVHVINRKNIFSREKVKKGMDDEDGNFGRKSEP